MLLIFATNDWFNDNEIWYDENNICRIQSQPLLIQKVSPLLRCHKNRKKVAATNGGRWQLVHKMFTNTHPAFCRKDVRCKVKGGLEQQRARFYRGARFRISLILSHRNLVGECLPQTLLYAAWRLRQPRPATELCKLHRRARFWKPLELQPAPAASTEEFFSPAYSTNGRFLSVEK